MLMTLPEAQLWLPWFECSAASDPTPTNHKQTPTGKLRLRFRISALQSQLLSSRARAAQVVRQGKKRGTTKKRIKVKTKQIKGHEEKLCVRHIVGGTGAEFSSGLRCSHACKNDVSSSKCKKSQRECKKRHGGKMESKNFHFPHSNAFWL